MICDEYNSLLQGGSITGASSDLHSTRVEENLNPEILLNLPTSHCTADCSCKRANSEWACVAGENSEASQKTSRGGTNGFHLMPHQRPSASSHRCLLIPLVKKRGQTDSETTARETDSPREIKPRTKKTNFSPQRRSARPGAELHLSQHKARSVQTGRRNLELSPAKTEFPFWSQLTLLKQDESLKLINKKRF